MKPILAALMLQVLHRLKEMKFCFRAILPVMIFAGMIMVPQATARPITKTSYTYYSITGKTAATLYRQMVARGPHVSGSRAFAATRAVQKYQREFKRVKNGCRVKRFKLSIDFRISLPRLANRRGVSKTTLQRWRQFSGFVKRHELKHRAIWLSCGRAIEQRIASVRATSCALAEEKVAAIIRQEQRSCDRKHDRFESADQRRLARHPLVVAAFSVKKRQRSTKSRTTRARSTFGLRSRFDER